MEEKILKILQKVEIHLDYDGEPSGGTISDEEAISLLMSLVNDALQRTREDALKEAQKSKTATRNKHFTKEGDNRTR